MVIGITGRSCAGKDRGARFLEEHGVPVVDVDKLGHEALAANIDKIRSAFGEEVIAPDGTVDRKKLGGIVFSDHGKLEELNSISHPWMVERVKDFIVGKKVCAINAALLEKMGLLPLCDEVLFFLAPYEVREKRAVKRDSITPEAFRRRDESQKEIGSTLFSSGRRVVTILNGEEGGDSLCRQLTFYCGTLHSRGFTNG